MVGQHGAHGQGQQGKGVQGPRGPGGSLREKAAGCLVYQSSGTGPSQAVHQLNAGRAVPEPEQQGLQHRLAGLAGPGLEIGAVLEGEVPGQDVLRGVVNYRKIRYDRRVQNQNNSRPGQQGSGEQGQAKPADFHPPANQAQQGRGPGHIDSRAEQHPAARQGHGPKKEPVQQPLGRQRGRACSIHDIYTS